MDAFGNGSPCLPPELLLRILALLPPNDLALSGRLAWKEAAQCFQGPQYCTLFLGKPLPDQLSAHVASSSSPTAANATTATARVSDTNSWFQTSAEEALRQLTFRRKLLLLSTAAASGCEANVEFAWQLLQPHVFPELLQSNHYRNLLQRDSSSGAAAPDVGSVAIASGLARLLPSLAQRCPGLLDPGATLEAAARHCDLAGLQAAWEAVGQRLQQGCNMRDGQAAELSQRGQAIWQRMLTAAAASNTPDAVAKLEWVLGMSGGASDPAVMAQAYGAAAASGDLARVGWLQDRGVGWGTPGALEAVVEHADLGCIQQLEEAGADYLPPAHDESWSRESVVSAAATSRNGSAAKLRWLAGRRADLGVLGAVVCAARRGDLEAVQLLVGHWRARHGAAVPPPDDALTVAIASGSVPTATFLRQAGCGLGPFMFVSACARGHLPMVMWLAEAGCPFDRNGFIRNMVEDWPRDSAADGERLFEAIRVLSAELGAPAGDVDQLLDAAVDAGHPWAVLQGLLQRTGRVGRPPYAGSTFLTSAGCEATLRALLATGSFHREKRNLQDSWYGHAAAKGDLGTMACLRRLGVRLGRGVIERAVCEGVFREGAPLPALKWLTENGARWGKYEFRDTRSCLAAAYPAPREQERREVEAWLREQLDKQLAADRQCALLMLVALAVSAGTMALAMWRCEPHESPSLMCMLQFPCVGFVVLMLSDP